MRGREGEAGERQGEECTDQRPTWGGQLLRRSGGGEAGGGRREERTAEQSLAGRRETSCRLSRPAIVTNPRKSHKVAQSQRTVSRHARHGVKGCHCHSVADAQASVPAALDVGEEGTGCVQVTAIITLDNLHRPWLSRPPVQDLRSGSHTFSTLPFQIKTPTVLLRCVPRPYPLPSEPHFFSAPPE